MCKNLRSLDFVLHLLVNTSDDFKTIKKGFWTPSFSKYLSDTFSLSIAGQLTQFRTWKVETVSKVYMSAFDHDLYLILEVI